MAHYTEAFSDRIEAADHPFYIGQQMFTEHLSIRQARALLNPRECEYKLRLDDSVFIIKDTRAGRLFLQDHGDGYIEETSLVDVWWAFFEANEIELISCKPHAHKPKPLTCYMTEDNGGEPYLCVVNRQGGTEFFSQDSVHNSAVLDRDTIQALMNPVNCQFVLDFGFDHESEVFVEVEVNRHGYERTAAEIAKASFLRSEFKVTNIRSA